jgi:glucans biosynthesis protein C
MNTPRQSRFEDIDALRSVLMMASLMLHAACVYATNKPHITDNVDRSPFFAWLVNGLHLAITPSFFVVGAFFTGMMLSRSSWQAVVAERLRRLLLPTITVALTFNSVENYLRYLDRGGSLSFPSFLGSAEFLQLWIANKWQLHLWFMLHLMAFTTVLIACVALLPQISRKLAHLGQWIGDRLAAIAISHIGLAITLLGLAGVNLLTSGAVAQLPSAYDLILPGFATPYALVGFFPFFVFGLLLQASPKLRLAIYAPKFWLPVLMILGFVLQPYADAKVNFWFQTPLETNEYLQTLMLFAQNIVCWSIVIGGLQLFHRFCSTGNPMWRRWSARSHSMYLFHHALVYAGGMLLIQVALPPAVEFVLLMVVVATIVVLIHDKLVMRFDLLGLLFNGRSGFKLPDAILQKAKAIVAAR